jgi:hypothetical protein
MSSCIWNAQGDLLCNDKKFTKDHGNVEHYRDVPAQRKLFSQSDADKTCPYRCAKYGGWNGNWLGGAKGHNKCGCKN